MPGSIQQQPRGILALLGLKTTGRNADQWPEIVYPMIEQLEFYALDQLQVRSTTGGTVQNPGDEVELIVPNTELWLVRSVSAQPGTVGTTINWASLLSFQVTTGQPDTVLASDWFDAKAVAGVPTLQAIFPRPFLAPPGSRFTYRLTRSPALGAAVVVTVTALCTPLQA